MDKYQLEEKIQELREETKEVDAIRAYLNGHTDCPKCGVIMPFYKVDRLYTHCLNPECKLYRILFQRPSIILHKIFDDDGSPMRAGDDNSV